MQGTTSKVLLPPLSDKRLSSKPIDIPAKTTINGQKRSRSHTYEGNRFYKENRRVVVPPLSLPELAVEPRSPIDARYTGSSYLVLIAVDVYTDPHFPSLRSPVADAERLSGTLVRKGFSVYKKLYNKLATPENILRCFDDLSRQSAIGRLIVYIGCHGFNDVVFINGVPVDIPYFALSNTEKYRPRSTAFPMSSLKTLCSGIPSIHQCYIIDSCHSGAALYQSRSSHYFSELLMRRSCVALCSSSSDQLTVEDGGGSVLVTALINVLNSSNLFSCVPSLGRKYITLSSIVDLVKRNVYTRTAQLGTCQLVQYGSLVPINEGCMIFFEDSPDDEEKEIIRPVSV